MTLKKIQQLIDKALSVDEIFIAIRLLNPILYRAQLKMDLILSCKLKATGWSIEKLNKEWKDSQSNNQEV